MMKRFVSSPWLFLPFLLLYLLQATPRLWTDSALTDEAWFLTNGYCYWHYGEVHPQSSFTHTPFSIALQALPLTALDLKPPPRDMDEENRAHLFFTILNRNRVDSMLVLGRLISLLLGAAFGWLLLVAARPLGPLVAFFALSLWAFDPTFLAWAPTAKTDVPSAFFALAACLFFLRASEKSTKTGSFLSGLLLAMAATAKLSNLTLLPACFLLDVWRTRPWTTLWRRWFLIFLGFSAWLFLLYSPGFPQYPFPWTPFQEFLQRLQAPSTFRGIILPPFLFGHPSKHGLWLYYLSTFLLKSTLSFLVLFFLGVTLLATRKIRTQAWVWVFPLLLAFPLLTLPMGSHRYLLTSQTFFLLIAALAAQWLWDLPIVAGRPYFRYAVVTLLLAHGLSVGFSFPRHLSYFNDAVPKERRMHLLGDYEFDVSQDFKRLSRIAKMNGWEHIRLATVSMNDPSIYGLPWQRWTECDLKGPQPGWVYVTSISFLQGAPTYYPQTYPIAMSWVRRLPPTQIVGDTLLIHEFPGQVALKDDSRILDSAPYLRMDPTRPGKKGPR